jgi:hypothetical protein
MTYLQANPFTGPCSPSTQMCGARLDLSKPTPRCCVDCHVKMMQVIAPLLDKAGVRWWIDYGMLLGFEVNGGFYWNDRDIDISVLAEDREKVREIGRQLTRSHRYLTHYKPLNLNKKWTYSDCVKISNSVQNRATLDITFWEQEDGVLDRQVWASVDKWKGRETPVDWVFPTVRGKWEGVDVAVPREALKLVEYRYGPQWKNLPAARTSGDIRAGYLGNGGDLYFGRSRHGCEVTDDEGLVLKRYASMVPEDQAIVEIGAYKGRSMCWLAAGSNEGNKAPVFSVDLWEEGPGYALTRNKRRIPRPYAEPTTREAYEKLRDEYGYGLVTPIRGDSPTIARQFGPKNLQWPKPVGMLFIDGDHTEKGVAADVEAWLPKVAPDAIVAFHDMNAPGVLSTLKRTLEKPNSGWEQVEAVRLLAVYIRKENVMRYLETKQGQAEAERDKRFEVKLGTGPAENKAAIPKGVTILSPEEGKASPHANFGWPKAEGDTAPHPLDGKYWIDPSVYHGPPLSGFVEKPKRKRRKKSEEPSEEETSG